MAGTEEKNYTYRETSEGGRPKSFLM